MPSCRRIYIVPRRSRTDMGLPEGKTDSDGSGAPRRPREGPSSPSKPLNRLADSGRTDAHAVFFGAIRDPHAPRRPPSAPHGPRPGKRHRFPARAVCPVHRRTLLIALRDSAGTLVEGQAAGCSRELRRGRTGRHRRARHQRLHSRYRDTADLAGRLLVMAL